MLRILRPNDTSEPAKCTEACDPERCNVDQSRVSLRQSLHSWLHSLTGLRVAHDVPKAGAHAGSDYVPRLVREAVNDLVGWDTGTKALGAGQGVGVAAVERLAR